MLNFRGRVLWVSKTFSDDHCCLHIPSGFDPKNPRSCWCLFHGPRRDAGARRARPASACRIRFPVRGPMRFWWPRNSPLTPPLPAPGKFWEQDGFGASSTRAAQKLAGCRRSAQHRRFYRVTIVLVSYSGGFGPTLSVLARGGANARIHGIVMLELRSMLRGWMHSRAGSPIACQPASSGTSSYTPTPRIGANSNGCSPERSVHTVRESTDNLEGTVATCPPTCRTATSSLTPGPTIRSRPCSTASTTSVPGISVRDGFGAQLTSRGARAPP